MLITNEILNSELIARNALIVHFSHHANMRQDGTFPQDLKNAMENKDIWALSCCVVWPKHNMDLPGSVGIIFQPTVESIISAHNTDSGSSSTPDGRDISLGSALSAETLVATFQVTSGYNEWRLKGAPIKGIFISDIQNIMVKGIVKVSCEIEDITTISLSNIEINRVFEIFEGYSIFTINDSSIVEIKRE